MLLIHTQAFEIRPDNRGLGCDSQPAQGRSKVWAPGQGRPSPSVPSECGQQDPRSGGDESPPALARAAAHCLCKGCALGKVSATPPFLSLSLPSSRPWVAPVATLRTQIHQPSTGRREGLSLVPPASSPSHSVEGLSVKRGSGAVKGPYASVGPTETQPLRLGLVFV